MGGLAKKPSYHTTAAARTDSKAARVVTGNVWLITYKLQGRRESAGGGDGVGDARDLRHFVDVVYAKDVRAA